MLQADLDSAVAHGVESTTVDYKAQFDPSSPADWVEIVKDLVAMANAGGGVIIFGLTDDGTLSAYDCRILDAIDPAVITDKVFRYTGQQFRGFTFMSAQTEGKELFAIAVDGVVTPIVFSKPGTYDIGGGKQKRAFSEGTVYFRHGAKSEPANSDDLRLFIEERIELMRKTWFEGIIKVVEAPPGSQVEVIPPEAVGTETGQIRLVNDENAPALRQISVDETHPFRQKEVVAEVNKALAGAETLNSYNIQCIRQVYEIEKNPTFSYKMRHSAAQYSQAFVDWVVSKYSNDAEFFNDARKRVQQKNK